MWTSCQKEVKYHADENKSYAFITDTEGYIYCYDSENEEIIYYTSPSDGSYPIQAVNC